MEQLTKNFNSFEFYCKDGTPVPAMYKQNMESLAENLQVLRDYFNLPIHINSAYRTESHNRKIGGSPNSQHLLCKAADIVIASKTPKQVVRAIKKLISEGEMKEGGIGLYNGFVHYDIRGYAARWNFSSLFNF